MKQHWAPVGISCWWFRCCQPCSHSMSFSARRGHGWSALFAALAALGRNDLVMAWPFYGLMLLVRGRRIRDLFWMGPGFATAGIIYGVFNYSRYGTFLDQSLRLWYRCCDGGGYFNPAFGKAIPSPFSIHFLPANLDMLLFMGWGFNDTFPWLHPLGAGQALLLTSPAFVLALRASLKQPLTGLLWLAAILTMSASLIVYAPGFVQFGTRYYVQIYPFLLVLVAWAWARPAYRPAHQNTYFWLRFSWFLSACCTSTHSASASLRRLESRLVHQVSWRRPDFWYQTMATVSGDANLQRKVAVSTSKFNVVVPLRTGVPRAIRCRRIPVRNRDTISRPGHSSD